MALDDSIAISAPGASAAPQVSLIKTFRVRDVTGAIVEIQATSLVDIDGRPYYPMSEDTGQKLLRMVARLVNVTAAGFDQDWARVAIPSDDMPEL